MENTNYGRNESRKSGSVDDEVKRLLRKSGKITSQDFMKLRSMYKDDEIVNKIQSTYIAKQSNILKKASKFAALIREKYSAYTYIDNSTFMTILPFSEHKMNEDGVFLHLAGFKNDMRGDVFRKIT